MSGISFNYFQNFTWPPVEDTNMRGIEASQSNLNGGDLNTHTDEMMQLSPTSPQYRLLVEDTDNTETTGLSSQTNLSGDGLNTHTDEMMQPSSDASQLDFMLVDDQIPCMQTPIEWMLYITPLIIETANEEKKDACNRQNPVSASEQQTTSAGGDYHNNMQTAQAADAECAKRYFDLLPSANRVDNINEAWIQMGNSPKPVFVVWESNTIKGRYSILYKGQTTPHRVDATYFKIFYEREQSSND